MSNISGRFWAKAQHFQQAARLIIENQPEGWIVPASFLVGFGWEIGLKSFLLEGGASERELKGFGHKISDLWEDKRLLPIKEISESYFEENIGKFPQYDKHNSNENPLTLKHHIEYLDYLHSYKSGFYLRYSDGKNRPYPDPVILEFVLRKVLDSAPQFAPWDFKS